MDIAVTVGQLIERRVSLCSYQLEDGEKVSRPLDVVNKKNKIHYGRDRWAFDSMKYKGQTANQACD